MNILLVEDDNSHAQLIQGALGRSQMKVLRAATAHRALAMLDDRPLHVVLLDYSLPDGDGLDLLKAIRARFADLPVIFLTSADSAEICARALKGGARDYIVKKRNYLDVLPKIVSEACLAPADEAVEQDGAVIGASAAMRQLRVAIARAAASTAMVLIEGEPGTGKKFAARAIHQRSSRARAPFISINCAEIGESSVEGGLANRNRLFESAQGGTLLFEKMERLPQNALAKLLRVLETREFKAVGTSSSLHDVRVIVTWNKDVERLVQRERFREDSFLRPGVLWIRVPPLREHSDDIPQLAEHWLRLFNRQHGTQFAKFSGDAFAALTSRPWPGNVRELENLIERTLANSVTPTIDERGIHVDARDAEDAEERRRIEVALERNHWNRRRSATELGISRITLWRRMLKYKFQS